jgi:septum site-determining protein MinC
LGSSSVNIICIVDHDEIADEVLQKKLGLVPEAPEPVPEEKEESRIFYRGSLVPGEEICSDGPVIIIGDVPVGAKVASDSNIIVLGRLAGSAFAGLSIDEERFEESPFIAALEFEPESYSIMGVYGKPVKPSKKGGIFSRNKASCGAIADIKDGFIAVHPLYER